MPLSILSAMPTGISAVPRGARRTPTSVVMNSMFAPGDDGLRGKCLVEQLTSCVATMLNRMPDRQVTLRRQ